MIGIELFAGAGGLLLGSALAGVQHIAAVEWNKWACATMRENANNGYPLVNGLNVLQCDVRDVDWSSLAKQNSVDIITAGPPCQPFSLGGLARSADDPRDMFPATTSVIAKLQPRAFVIENVKGITRPSFSEYFEYIRLRLQHPELAAKANENWREHYVRLQREHTSVATDLKYNLITTLVNAADYGVPQHRHRVFIVGFRSDVNAQWSFPSPTHSGGALAFSQDIGSYWDKWNVPLRERVPIQQKPRMDGLKPWVTVREALYDMPQPGNSYSPSGWLDHKFQEGARAYPGHTGSPIDEPSKALKAGAHGVPGGENMIKYPDGTVRYYSVREAARIQTFPDRYALHGAWGEAMRQLGNAVPVLLAERIMLSVVEHLQQDAALQDVSRSVTPFVVKGAS
jgi:DNA (cytosine-5)-methyltransferase 1